MDVELDSETTSPEEYEPLPGAVRAYITEKAPHHGENRGPTHPSNCSPWSASCVSSGRRDTR